MVISACFVLRSNVRYAFVFTFVHLYCSAQLRMSNRKSAIEIESLLSLLFFY